MKIKVNLALRGMGKVWRLQNPENTWELLVFARNTGFSCYLLPKNVKVLKCLYPIKLNELRGRK